MAKTRSTRRRPFRLVEHFKQEAEAHPVDAAVSRHPEVRALRERARQATKVFEKVLGLHLDEWLHLEETLVELAATREGLMFDRGHAHGYASGRAEAMKSTPEGRALATLLRDLALQSGCPREVALAALLEAAWSLVAKGRPAGKRHPPR